MKKEIINKIIKIFGVILSLFNALMWLSMRPCWSGISKTLGYDGRPTDSEFLIYLPLIFCILFFLVCIANIVMYFVMKKEKNLWSYIFLGVNVLFFIIVIVVIAMGAKDYMPFIWVEFGKAVAITTAIGVGAFFIFWYHKTPLVNNKAFKFSLLGVLVISCFAAIMDFTVNYITVRPVVYVVEDEYQIVFSTNAKSLGWVEIDGIEYYDTYAGSQKSTEKVHKISVPQEVLNSAKSYTIHTQKLIYRGPFGGYKGLDLSETYNFKPVDSSDGIDYFNLTDVHELHSGSVKVASYASDMEVLVLGGDIVSMMDTEKDANFTNVLAHEITKGEVPVIYARGNHEIKGNIAEDFHKYVGSKNGDFYYYFTLDKIYGLVLDIGEDHEDEYWEYYGTAEYEAYRQDQLQYVKDEIAKGNYKNYDYQMVVCHIPLVFVNTRGDMKDFKFDITEELNKMGIDMSITGHQHELLIFDPALNEHDRAAAYDKTLEYNDDYKTSNINKKARLTHFNHPTLMASKRGLTQKDSPTLTKTEQIGLDIHVDLVNKKSVCSYLNVKGEKIDVVNPFYKHSYGDTMTFDFVDSL